MTKPIEDRTIVVSGHTFTLFAACADDEPRVRDVDLGRWLEYARPEGIRDLIKRLISRGLFKRDAVFRTARETSKAGGRPAQEFWPTRRQALHIIRHSGTAVADRFMDNVFDVFEQARAEATGEQHEEIEAQVERIVSARLAHLHLPAPVTGRAAQSYVAAPLKMLARRMAAIDPTLTERQHLGSLHIEFRDTLGLRRDARFAEIPTIRLGDAVSWIAARERAIARREKRSAKTKAPAKAQGSLRLVQNR